jgi:stage II sporulation protein D
VKAIEIVTDRGRYRVEGDRIRWVLRPNPNSDAILKSTLFKMDVKRIKGKVSAVNLVGGGNGHGIGMCQSGAIAMAAAGYSAEEILRHYYPGIVIRRSFK